MTLNIKISFIALLIAAVTVSYAREPAASGKADASTGAAMAQVEVHFRRANAALQTIALTAAVLAQAEGHGTLLRADYMKAQLDAMPTDPKLGHAFRAALKDHDSDVDAAAADVVHYLEVRFIHDPTKSSLDLLPPDQRDKFVNFAWDKDDFPGGKPGPHEDVADAMVNALKVIRPERRANSTADAVATKPEIMKTGWDWVVANEAPISGQPNRKLNKYALVSYQKMKAAAKADGVELFAVSSSRDPLVAARNAARTGNPNAVASFSSHSLGLAVDFRMSDAKQNFDEVNTEDMPGLVRMRTSAVHKWIFLEAAKYGWFPYMQEPWHWEYNPIGFRETYWKDHSGVPAG